jgi:hypothetical protein
VSSTFAKWEEGLRKKQEAGLAEAEFRSVPIDHTLQTGNPPTTDDEFKDRLIENAIDFLEGAIKQFKEQPKYSVIHFYAAVELFLKARLIKEHWSLIVFRDPDRHRFENGDFISVPFDVICERLRKVVQSAIPERAQKNFDTIRKHRNKMIHFFHPDENKSATAMRSVAEEQLRAWYDLNQLLLSQWAPVFEDHRDRLNGIERALKSHREYLQAKFDDLTPKIEQDKQAGVKFLACSSCKFEASRVTDIIGDLHEYNCLVCGFSKKSLDFECPECGEFSNLEDGSLFTCWNCDRKLDERGLVNEINEFVVTKDNYFDAVVPANCSECEGYRTVVEYKSEYLCVNCFTVCEQLEACGWCGEYNNGDMDGSSYSGCSVCDGAAGWHRDKD